MVPLRKENAASIVVNTVHQVSHTFRDLETLIDDVHGLFGCWSSQNLFATVLDDVSLHWARLAVHEWMANLIQHAEFGTEEPTIEFACRTAGDRLHCSITDNSAGFDFCNQLMRQKSAQNVASLPDRGMGLLMLESCTQEVRYHRGAPGHNRLDFYISADHEPCLNIRY